MSRRRRELRYYTFQALGRRKSRTVRAGSILEAAGRWATIDKGWACVSVKDVGTVSAPPRKGWSE